MNEDVIIRRAEGVADYVACQDAQRRAWGVTEASYVVPIATLVGAQLHGGLVLGAFRSDGTAVGVSFGFLGRVAGRLCLYSQLTGVAPGSQSLGIGGRLKYAQREFARESGLEFVAWAFDPLQAGNARFNLKRLGATAGRYIDNMYGPRSDALNLGAPTDRLIAEWVTSASDATTPPPEALRDAPRLIAEGPSVAARFDLSTPFALLEVPNDIIRLRAIDPSRAAAWQVAVRDAFHTAFAAGFRAVGFERGCYVLQRTDGRTTECR